MNMNMKIGEYLREKDKDTYIKLMKIDKKTQNKKNKEIRLGDRPERLMMHDAYKRIGRRIRQIRWG